MLGKKFIKSNYFNLFHIYLFSQTLLLLGIFEGSNTYNIKVPIPKDFIFPDVQWLTRLFAFKLSPFEITLEVDSDTVACGDILPTLQNIWSRKFGRLDFSVMGCSANLNSDFYPQNGIQLIF